MNRLSKKISAGIVVILTAAFVCSVLFNARFIETFYLHQKKEMLTEISQKFEGMLDKGNISSEAAESIEASYKVMIAEIKNEPAAGEDEINEKIQSVFREKGIGFQKYWFWEEDYSRVLEGKRQIRLYQQEKLNYSLMVSYVQKESVLYAVAMIVPNISDAFQIANQFLSIVTGITVIVAVLFLFLFVKKITKPLQLFEEFAANMRNNVLIPLNVHTGDELESTAESLNSMGEQLMTYQKSLKSKNLQMEQLLDDVAHELKTPVTLIGLYAEAIRDGLDDGTFLDTITDENNRMSHMIHRLLYFEKIGKKECPVTTVNLSQTAKKLVRKCEALAGENQIEICLSTEEDLVLSASEEMVETLFWNLITNGIKYTSGKRVFVSLYAKEREIIFRTVNQIQAEDLDTEKIWLPYYVGEESRSKKMSGTGLGLSIVKKICEMQNYHAECEVEEHKIYFTISFPLQAKQTGL